MPKRIKDKNKSIFVRFKHTTSDKEINEFLQSLGIYGTRAGTVVNRWAIEIPFWKENHFIQKMEESSIVDVVHENFDRKRKNRAEEELTEIEEE